MVIPRNGRGGSVTGAASAPAPAPVSAPVSVPGAAAASCNVHLSRAEMMQLLEDAIGGRSMMECAREWGVDFREIDKVRRAKQYPGAELCKVLGLEMGEKVWVRSRWR